MVISKLNPTVRVVHQENFPNFVNLRGVLPKTSVFISHGLVSKESKCLTRPLLYFCSLREWRKVLAMPCDNQRAAQGLGTRAGEEVEVNLSGLWSPRWRDSQREVYALFRTVFLLHRSGDPPHITSFSSGPPSSQVTSPHGASLRKLPASFHSSGFLSKGNHSPRFHLYQPGEIIFFFLLTVWRLVLTSYRSIHVRGDKGQDRIVVIRPKLTSKSKRWSR